MFKFQLLFSFTYLLTSPFTGKKQEMYKSNTAMARLLMAMVAVCVGIPLEDGDLNRQKRVIGGDTVTKGEFPFLVSLWFMGAHPFTARTPDRHHHCGGILVASQWVVTSAICFEEAVSSGLSNLSLWQAKLGMHAQTEADEEAQSCSIVQMIPSPEYNPGQGYGYLAVIKLDCEAHLNSAVATITINQDSSCPHTEQNVTVVGWGQTQGVTYGNGSDVPRKASVKTTSDDVCRQTYARAYIAKVAPNLRFGNATLCAGLPGGGAGACYGDDGGPLLAKCNGPDSPTVAVGIVSYGYGCARRNTSHVFARLSHFRNWIMDTINNN